MNIKQYFKNGGKWEIQCDTSTPYRVMTVNVGFSNSGEPDEAQFDIMAYNINELNELFNDFCKENNYIVNKIGYIHIVKTYENMEQLTMKI